MSDLITLIYGSSATQAMSDEMLFDILEKARAKNRKLNITGMLLYRAGNFLQVLEGERNVVEDLYSVIERDPRHHQVRVFAKRSVIERGFGDWEMGFVHMDTIDPKSIEGFTTFLNEPLNSEKFKDANFAFIFLKVFKESIR